MLYSDIRERTGLVLQGYLQLHLHSQGARVRGRETEPVLILQLFWERFLEAENWAYGLCEHVCVATTRGPLFTHLFWLHSFDDATEVFFFF